jgi:tagatose-6-phosphate ketose/aldose isomerase
MPQDSTAPANENLQTDSSFTRQEIYAQAHIWSQTVRDIVADADRLQLFDKLAHKRVVLTGAGTSAYAADAIAAAWPRARAVPTTDLLVDSQRWLSETDVLISLARSGDSPESAPVVQLARSSHPEIFQLAIVCNSNGALAQAEVDHVLTLDPRTDDHSLVMTSSFSNLVLAGMTLARPEQTQNDVENLSKRTAALLNTVSQAGRTAALRAIDRIVVLSSSPLDGWRNEAALKFLEMTAGRFPVLAESFLGLRHGPMSFLRPETLVFCLLSNDPLRREYELDLLRELRDKKIGYLVGIAEEGEVAAHFDQVIPAIAPHIEDALRTPYEIVAAQLLGYHLSLLSGLNPDNPSPDGVINRVVQGVTIHLPEPQGSVISGR